MILLSVRNLSRRGRAGLDSFCRTFRLVHNESEERAVGQLQVRGAKKESRVISERSCRIFSKSTCGLWLTFMDRNRLARYAISFLEYVFCHVAAACKCSSRKHSFFGHVCCFAVRGLASLYIPWYKFKTIFYTLAQIGLKWTQGKVTISPRCIALLQRNMVFRLSI